MSGPDKNFDVSCGSGLVQILYSESGFYQLIMITNLSCLQSANQRDAVGYQREKQANNAGHFALRMIAIALQSILSPFR